MANLAHTAGEVVQAAVQAAMDGIGDCPVKIPQSWIGMYLMQSAGASDVQIGEWLSMDPHRVRSCIMAVDEFYNRYPSVAQGIGVLVKKMPQIDRGADDNVILGPWGCSILDYNNTGNVA